MDLTSIALAAAALKQLNIPTPDGTAPAAKQPDIPAPEAPEPFSAPIFPAPMKPETKTAVRALQRAGMPANDKNTPLAVRALKLFGGDENKAMFAVRSNLPLTAATERIVTAAASHQLDVTRLTAELLAEEPPDTAEIPAFPRPKATAVMPDPAEPAAGAPPSAPDKAQTVSRLTPETLPPRSNPPEDKTPAETPSPASEPAREPEPETREENRPFPSRAEELAAKPGGNIKEVSAALTAIRKTARRIRRSLERALPPDRDVRSGRSESRCSSRDSARAARAAASAPREAERYGILRDSSKMHGILSDSSKIHHLARQIEEATDFFARRNDPVYAQIPILAESGARTAELFVFRRGGRPKPGDVPASALVSVDTARFGRAEAHIQKTGAAARITFRVTPDAAAVFAERSAELSSLLSAVGVTLASLAFETDAPRFSLGDPEPGTIRPQPLEPFREWKA